jgi:hypothetical protein
MYNCNRIGSNYRRGSLVMPVEMLLKVGFLRKPPLTILTHKGLFPSVHSQVVVEVVEFSEELIATGNVAF